MSSVLLRRFYTSFPRGKFFRSRHYWRNMDSDLLQPPAQVRGMLELQRDAFRKVIQTPRLCVRDDKINKVLPLVKKLLLKMEHLKPVRLLNKSVKEQIDEHNSITVELKEILLHPLPVKSWESLPIEALQELKIDPKHFYFEELELNYSNWRADEIFKSVLPAEDEGLTSFSRIGHIIHLNLRDHLLPYKQLIGQVLCDKVPNCRTVVNKAANIDNTYRNFQLELICGDPDYLVETKENGIRFQFDFSLVYWNPRLCTEHERIINLLKSGDVLYDVFAGVGPFSVPIAKKGCQVLANDLNPQSFHWLQKNAKLNKCNANIKLFNKDGRDFILEDIKTDLLQRWTESTVKNKENTYNMHITMNLPAMAVEFLDAFRGLFAEEFDKGIFSNCSEDLKYPTVHVYTFAKGVTDTKELAQELVEKHLGMPLKDILCGVHFVRNVAPNKDMYRVSFVLTKEILSTTTKRNEVELKNDENKNTEKAPRKRPADIDILEDDEDLKKTIKVNGN